MNPVTTIGDLKQEHDILFGEAFAQRTLFLENRKRDREYIKSFKGRANHLLESLTELSGQVTSVDDYNMLSEIASQWQVVFSTILNEPVDIKIHPPSLNMWTNRPLTEEELKSNQEMRAKELSIIRRINNILQQARTDLKDDSSREQKEGDWHNAQVEFAWRVLEGKINFIQQLSPESYWRLEDVWLREVKRYKAYCIWESRGSPFTWNPNPDADYLRACDAILDKLVDPDIKKSSLTEFEKARTYLMHYLSKDGRLDAAKSEKFIQQRAYHVWKSGGEDDEQRNYGIAETYLKMFYENIIPAVMRDDEESTLLVLKSFQYSRALGGRYLFINCFEVALAVYFLNPSIIGRLWAKSAAGSRPESWLRSEVPVNSWPGYLLSKDCGGKFTYDWERQRIAFEGVMTKRECAALLKGLTRDEHRRAVIKLYRLSRCLPRDMTI